MSDFGDIERFARSHAACGGITPNATTQTGGGYLLTLTCACGAAMDRWITPEEAKLPLPLSAPPCADASPALPKGPAAARAPEKPKAPAPSGDLQEALRQALEAEEAADSKAGPAPAVSRSPSSDLDEALRLAIEAEPPAAKPAAAPARPRERPVPPRLNLDAAMKRAMDSQTAARAAPRPTTSRFWFGAVVVVLVIGGVVLWLGLQALDEDARLESRTAAPTAVAPPPASEVERAAFADALRALKDIQAVSTPTVPYPVYSSRVAFAKADVNRYLGVAAAPELKAGVRDTMELHVLAAAAWRARTLDSKEMWEALGQDPAIDLCPSARRVIDFAETPGGQSRAHARGLSVAVAIPLLWECAGARLNGLDR